MHDLDAYTQDQICSINYVSRSTLDRFCKSIGYENYRDLKDSAKAYADKPFHVPADRKTKIQGILKEQGSYTDKIDAVVNEISNYAYTYVLIPGELYGTAMSFQREMMHFGKMIILVPNIDRHFDDIKESMQESLVLLADTNDLFSHTNVEYLKTMSCRTVCLHFDSEITHYPWDIELNIGKRSDIFLRKYQLSFCLDIIVERFERMHEK